MTFFSGWLIEPSDRDALMEIVPPAYKDVIAHHITLAYGVPGDTPLPTDVFGEVVGVADDHSGVQALVVAIAGSPLRPDGKYFHITWSIDRAAGRRPSDSNAVIAALGWKTLSASYPLTLIPAVMD